jgi:ketosteroid isomerase-like protein
MKKSLSLAFILGCVTLGFSQPTFTEKTLTEMRQRMLSDWDNYFKDEVSPDYVMQGHVGQTCDKACISELNKNATLLEWPMEEVKIRQVGNAAIVTGISHHVALFKKSNTKVQNNQRFTDTYEYKNGKWLWLTAQFTDIAPPVNKTAEEEAIKKMLDESKKASDAGDLKAYKSHWLDAPYVSYQYNGQSFVGDAFWKKAEEMYANRKPTNIITTRSDWNFAIKGGSAFVTFSQKSENVEKKTINETYEERYVEKVNGEWKMVNMTAIKKAN